MSGNNSGKKTDVSSLIRKEYSFKTPRFPQEKDSFVSQCINLYDMDNFHKHYCRAQIYLRKAVSLYLVEIFGNDPVFFTNEYNKEKHSSELNKKGNCISFCIQPDGERGFYQFEANPNNKKAAHYYSKSENGKYKPQRINMEWNCEFCQKIPVAKIDGFDLVSGVDDYWRFLFSIPLENITMSLDNILNYKFLLVKYSYWNLNFPPKIINSMGLPKRQMKDPEKWNVISYSNMGKKDETLGTFCKINNEKYNEKKKEKAAYSDTIKAYLDILTKSHKLVGDKKFQKTFSKLWEFIYIPEFDEKELNKINFIYNNLKEAIEEDNHKSIYDAVSFIDVIMEGTEYLVKRGFIEARKQENISNGQTVRKEGNTPIKSKNHSQYHPCFIEIKKKEKDGITYGRKGPLNYIYNKCKDECKNNWPIKFRQFRRKYAKWEKEKGDSQETLSRCKYGNKCSEW